MKKCKICGYKGKFEIVEKDLGNEKFDENTLVYLCPSCREETEMNKTKLTLDDIGQLEILINNYIDETDVKENAKCYKKIAKKLQLLKKEELCKN